MKIPNYVIETAESIRIMEVRGASLIARTAAKVLKEAADDFRGKGKEEFMEYLREVARILLETRPTAVSLPNAIHYIMRGAERGCKRDFSLEELRDLVRERAETFIREAIEATERASSLAAQHIGKVQKIMTHCHSTAAVNTILKIAENRSRIIVYVKETRPRYQGRITMRQLSSYSNIEVRFIVDSAAAYYMKDVDVVIVGADAITPDGYLFNKVGTFMLAITADEFNVPFYTVAEHYKLAVDKKSWRDIVVEMRPIEEVIEPKELPNNVKVLNPSFDITPPSYLTGIITNKGIIEKPVTQHVAEFFSKFSMK